jgi:hypothetical protein
MLIFGRTPYAKGIADSRDSMLDLARDVCATLAKRFLVSVHFEELGKCNALLLPSEYGFESARSCGGWFLSRQTRFSSEYGGLKR